MVLALLCSLLEINSSPLAVSQTALKQRQRPKETRRSSILSSEPQTNRRITFQWRGRRKKLPLKDFLKKITAITSSFIFSLLCAGSTETASGVDL